MKSEVVSRFPMSGQQICVQKPHATLGGRASSDTNGRVHQMHTITDKLDILSVLGNRKTDAFPLKDTFLLPKASLEFGTPTSAWTTVKHSSHVAKFCCPRRLLISLLLSAGQYAMSPSFVLCIYMHATY